MIEGKTSGGDRKGKIAAGVFTQPYAVQYVLDALEHACESGIIDEADVTQEKLENFLSHFGRSFYKVQDERKERILVRRKAATIAHSLKGRGEHSEIEVVPFRRGETTWALEWR